MSSKVVSVVLGAVAIAAAIPTGGASLTLMQGVAMAGGAMSIIGGVTGNSSLQTMGAVATAGGGLGGGLTNPDSFLKSVIGGNTNPGLNPQANPDNPATAAGGNVAQSISNPAESNMDQFDEAGGAPAGYVPQPYAGNANPSSLSALESGNGPTQIPSGNAAAEPTVAANANEVAAGNAGTAPGAPSTDSITGWLKAQKNPLVQAELVKTGAGLLGGAMSYIAPNPMQKAQIAQQNAQTALLQQQLGQRAALNASINAVGPTGWNTNGVAPGSAGVAPPTGPAGQGSVGLLGGAMAGNPAISAI